MEEAEHHSLNTEKQDLHQFLAKVPSTIHCALAGEMSGTHSVISISLFDKGDRSLCLTKWDIHLQEC